MFKDQTERDERFPPRTLADVATAYWEGEKSPTVFHGHKPSQWFNPMRLYVLPKLGKRQMDTISVNEMAKLLNDKRRHSNDQARKVVVCLRQIYRYARRICGQRVDRNFMEDIEEGLRIEYRGKKRVQRKASLSWAEIAGFYQILGDDLEDLAIRILILTGLRTQNMRWLTWDEIQGDLWVIDGSRMKVKGALV